MTCHVTKNKRYDCKKTLKSCQKYLARAIQGVKHVTALPFLPPSKDNFLMKTENTLISKTPEDRGMAKSTKTISYIQVLPLSPPQNKSYFNHHMLLTFLFLSIHVDNYISKNFIELRRFHYSEFNVFLWYSPQKHACQVGKRLLGTCEVQSWCWRCRDE